MSVFRNLLIAKALKKIINYLSYLGSYFTATNTLNGTTKDLQIRGKTYHNLARLDLPVNELFDILTGNHLSNGKITLDRADATNYVDAFYNYNMQIYKPSTQYTLVLDITKNNTVNSLNRINSVEAFHPSIFEDLLILPNDIGRFKYLITTCSDMSDATCVLRTHLSISETGSITYSFMILEGDYTNIDLPSTITGIESVNGDVTVKSVGKNLVNAIEGERYSANKQYIISVKPNTAYSISLSQKVVANGIRDVAQHYYKWLDVNNNSIEQNVILQFHDLTLGGVYSGTDTKTSPSTATKLSIDIGAYFGENSAVLETIYFQIEESSTATDYEPYTEDTVDFGNFQGRSLPDGTCDSVEYRASRNLLDFSGAVGGNSNGITCTITDDGNGYTYVGTATDTAINVWLIGNYQRKPSDGHEVFIVLKKGVSYRQSGFVACGYNYNESTFYGFSNYATITPSEDIYITGIRAVTAIVGETYNDTFYPMIVEGDTTPEYFELYDPEVRLRYVQKIIKYTIDDFALSNVISGTSGSRFKAGTRKETTYVSEVINNYFRSDIAKDSYTIEGEYVSTSESLIAIRLNEILTLAEFKERYPDLVVYAELRTPIVTPLETPLTELSTYNESTTVSVETDSNIIPDAYMQIPTDETGLQEYEDAVEALTDLGITPSDYHNVNMDALADLGVEI